MNPSTQNDFALNLISSKLVGFREIVLPLFENCNLSCAFCPQQHESTVGMSHEEIMTKVDLIARYANESTGDAVHLHVMGGELFQDHLLQKGFVEIYEEFMARIREKVQNPERLVFNFVTNLVTTNIEEVKKFCIRNNLKVSVSYDPTGRFSAQNLEIFTGNLDIMQDHIRMISCVITKPNIQKIFAGDALFEKLYQRHDVDWDPLLPSLKNSAQLMPKESELLKFLKFLVDHYPDCINLENFFATNSQQKMRCTRGRSLTIMPNNQIPLGCSGSLFLKEAKTEDLGGNEIISQFLHKFDCLTCAYFSKCSFTCFIKQDYKRLVEDVSGCVYKEVYNHIENKKQAPRDANP